MKIINIMQCTNLGGMEQASLRLMQGLQDRRHSLEVLSLNPIGALGPLLMHAGIPAKGLNYSGRGGWKTGMSIYRNMRSIKADAVMMTGHHLLTMLLLGNIARGKRILAIHHYHAGIKSSRQWRWIYKIAMKRFQTIVFPCDFLRNEACAIYPAISPISVTLYNPLPISPIPSTEEKRNARRSHGLPENGFIIGNAGRLIPSKRFELFLKVAARVHRVCPQAYFIVAGDGPEHNKLIEICRELHLEDNIHWIGWQGDLTHFYQSLDVLLFNSDFDAMGMTALEAMSYGVPVVASVLRGGISEIISDDRYGFLQSTHDIEWLTQKVLDLVHHPQLACEIGQKGRFRVQQICTPEQCVNEYERLLSGLADRKGKDNGC
jgi:glycosyltransferase involved in cell wall biosynthesis